MKRNARPVLAALHILAVFLLCGIGNVPAEGKGTKGKVIYTFTSIDPPGSTLTDARGINDAGQIVGDFDAGGHGAGFLFDGTSFTTIDITVLSRQELERTSEAPAVVNPHVLTEGGCDAACTSSCSASDVGDRVPLRQFSSRPYCWV